MISYKLVGKIALAIVNADVLPRIGDMLVVPDGDGKPQRFRVTDVQHFLRKAGDMSYIAPANSTSVEVYTELLP